MSRTWNKFRIYCNVSHQFEYIILETEIPPTTCPVDASHSINPDSISIIETLSDNLVTISQQVGTDRTNGAYTLHGRAFNAIANTTTYDAFYYDIPISMLAGIYTSNTSQEGDVISVHLLPQTPSTVGVITASVNDDDTVINVSPTVLAFIELFKVPRIQLLEGGTGRTSNKAKVSSIDAVAGTITVSEKINSENGEPFVYTNPTYVKLDTNIIGYITAAYTIDGIWITVSSTVITTCIIGYWINLFQSAASKTEHRMIVEIDVPNSRVRIASPFNVVLNPVAATVYVQLSVTMVYNYELEAVETIHPGSSTSYGKYLSNIVILFEYKRNSNTDTRVRYKYEFLY